MITDFKQLANLVRAELAPELRNLVAEVEDDFDDREPIVERVVGNWGRARIAWGPNKTWVSLEIEADRYDDQHGSVTMANGVVVEIDVGFVVDAKKGVPSRDLAAEVQQPLAKFSTGFPTVAKYPNLTSLDSAEARIIFWSNDPDRKDVWPRAGEIDLCVRAPTIPPNFDEEQGARFVADHIRMAWGRFLEAVHYARGFAEAVPFRDIGRHVQGLIGEAAFAASERGAPYLWLGGTGQGGCDPDPSQKDEVLQEVTSGLPRQANDPAAGIPHLDSHTESRTSSRPFQLAMALGSG